MKAMVWTRYGSPDVLQLRELEKPVPGNNQVLIKISATTVTAGDCEIRSMKVPIMLRLPIRLWIGLRAPKRVKIIGQELAGIVESVGKDVKKFKEGDSVFAATGFSMGTYAEYICLPEHPKEITGLLSLMPENMTFEEAASVPVGGLEALYFLRKADIRSGQNVLVAGAGGSIGTFAVQLSKYYGAEVTAVDSGGKLEMLSSIGADYCIDYTKDDFTESDKTWDIIFDIVGRYSFSGCLRSLNENGRYIIANPGPVHMLRKPWVSKKSGIKVITGASNSGIEDIGFLKKLIERGRLKSVIDRCFSLEQIADAHRYVEKGEKQGSVVITVGD